MQPSLRIPASVAGTDIETAFTSQVIEASQDVTSAVIPAGEWNTHEGEDLSALKGLLCARRCAVPPTFISVHPYCNTKRLGIATQFYRPGN